LVLLKIFVRIYKIINYVLIFFNDETNNNKLYYIFFKKINKMNGQT
jgi:hypothetical protein